jgi:RNA polymerase sigma-70 factor, ECF subfamily
MNEEVKMVDFSYLGAITEGLNKDQVLTDLMSEHGKDVWKYALFLTLNPNSADDIMQEVFLKVYEKMYSFRGQASVKTWLFTITRNVVKDQWKSAWSRKIILIGSRRSPEILPSAEQEVMSQLQEQNIWRYVLKLPTKYRELLLLQIHHELTLAEIAAILHISEGTVKSRLHRARTQMNKRIQEGELLE